MKYLVTWNARDGGSAADNEEAVKRTLAVYSKWSPPGDATFHQFLTRLDGAGGCAVVETDNPASVAEGPSKFGPYFDFEITPMLDITEGVPLLNEGIEFRDSIR
ncbi:MAG TPA: DUF3303 family protein [Acidimicrobiia bacterium]|nr:DUF3303 family protein [Acidimicrobiia bacterium]